METIRQQLPKAKIVDGSPVYWEQRQIKTDYEIEIIRKLCAITVKGIEAGFNQLKEGMTEIEIYTKIWEAWIRGGLHDCPMAGRLLMRSGKTGISFLNQPPTNRKFLRGDALFSTEVLATSDTSVTFKESFIWGTKSPSKKTPFGCQPGFGCNDRPRQRGHKGLRSLPSRGSDPSASLP